MNARILFVLCCLPLLLDARSRNAPKMKSISKRPDRLKMLLQEYFSEPRHPVHNEESWLYAREGVRATLTEILLSHTSSNTASMHIQEFQTDVLNDLRSPVPVKGENFIVTFPGRNRGTSSDEILLIGAHYDCDSTTLGLDDNGSGSAALLEIVFNLAETLTTKKFLVKNTIIFAFFDVQNMEHTLVTEDSRPGSAFYVEEQLGDFLYSPPIPTFRGAIILDAILNYNTTAHSQTLPPGFSTSFPEAHQSISQNNHHGDFLALVGKEAARSVPLENYLSQKWNEIDTEGRYPLLNLRMGSGNPTPATYEFLKQDHRVFWSYLRDNSSSPLPAVLLTDTGKYRSMPRQCSSTPCDISEILNDDHFSFMDQTISTINKLISETQLEAIANPTSKPTPSGGQQVSFSAAPLLFSLLMTFLICQS